METYPKIMTLFKRDQDGPNKGKIRLWDWTTNELMYLAGNAWEFTEKVDGTNIRVGFESRVTSQPTSVSFRGRTDRANIPTPLLDHLKETFTVDRFQEAGLDNVLLFGEGYGGKIQSGGNYRPDQSFVLFDVKIGDWWLKRDDVNDIANKLGIESVPVIGYGTLYEGVELVKPGTQMSRWGDFVAEGIVAVPTVPLFDRKGQRIITKIKEVDFRHL